MRLLVRWIRLLLLVVIAIWHGQSTKSISAILLCKYLVSHHI
jgi:hypothetical protein